MADDTVAFTFERDPVTGNVLGIPCGRLTLHDGTLLRLFFGPNGFECSVEQRAMGKSVHIMDWDIIP